MERIIKVAKNEINVLCTLGEDIDFYFDGFDEMSFFEKEEYNKAMRILGRA